MKPRLSNADVRTIITERKKRQLHKYTMSKKVIGDKRKRETSAAACLGDANGLLLIEKKKKDKRVIRKRETNGR